MALFRVAPVLGLIVWAFGLTLGVPWAVSVTYNDAAQHTYPATLAVCAVLGMLLLVGGRRRWRESDLQARDGILLVGLVWTLLPLLACLPLLLHFYAAGQPMGFARAYFETMSGLTTTGSTVLVGLDQLPPSINLWRCLLQWIGGMGILVLAVAILPMLGVGGSQLFRAEATGPMKDSKLTPRITETAKGLWTVYCGLSLACLLAYRWAA